jgi:hypothetical protein
VKTRRRVLFVILFVLALVVSLVACLLIICEDPSPLANIQPINSYYLLSPSGNESRIFLVSATPNYGTYPYPDAEGLPGKLNIHMGDPCLILNVTIRNDYSAQNPLPYGGFGDWSVEGTAFVALTAKLYDSEGKVIKATNVTPQYPSGSQFDAPEMRLESVTTYSFKMYLVITSRNVNQFSVELLCLGSVPAP